MLQSCCPAILGAINKCHSCIPSSAVFPGVFVLKYCHLVSIHTNVNISVSSLQRLPRVSDCYHHCSESVWCIFCNGFIFQVLLYCSDHELPPGVSGRLPVPDVFEERFIISLCQLFIRFFVCFACLAVLLHLICQSLWSIELLFFYLCLTSAFLRVTSLLHCCSNHSGFLSSFVRFYLIGNMYLPCLSCLITIRNLHSACKDLNSLSGHFGFS